MIVLDTTVLVYAVGDAHAFRDPCRRLMSAVADGTITASTTPEVVQEFAHVRARRRDREDATGLARAYADLLSPLLTVDEEALRTGLRLFRDHAGLGSFDAVLCAAAMLAGATSIASADAAFSKVPDVRHVVPDVDGVATLLLDDMPEQRGSR